MKFKSINSALAVLITVIVSISVISLVVVVSSMTNSAVLKIQEQNMEVLNNKIVNEVEQFLELSKSDLADYASNVELQDAYTDESVREGVMTHLRQKIENNSKLASLGAFGLDGKIVFGVKENGQSAAGTDLRSRKYVQDVLNGKAFAISDILKSKLDDRYIVVMAVPVRDRQGQLLGGFFSSVDWQEYAQSMIGDISIGEDGYAYILDGKGRMIAHKVNQALLLKDFTSHQFVKDSLAAPRGKTEYEWEGRAKVQMFQVVPSTGWVVCMSAYVSDLSRAAIEETQTSSLLWAL